MSTTHFDTPCEVYTGPTAGSQCGAPSTYRYAAMGGGWMHLCESHGAKHADISEHITRGDGAIVKAVKREEAAKRSDGRGRYVRTPEMRAKLSATMRAVFASKRQRRDAEGRP